MSTPADDAIEDAAIEKGWFCTTCGWHMAHVPPVSTVDDTLRRGVCRQEDTARLFKFREPYQQVTLDEMLVDVAPDEPESGPGFAMFTADDTPESVETKMANAFAPVHAMREALSGEALKGSVTLPKGWDFGGPVIANPDPNSQAAARSAEPGAPSARHRVWDLIRDHPNGLACWEVEQTTGGLHQSVSATINWLHNRGALVRRGMNHTPTGRRAYIYHAVEAGAVRRVEA